MIISKIEKAIDQLVEKTSKGVNEAWFAPDARYDELFNKLVAPSGKSDTIEGEMLRAINKIVYRKFNDGDFVHTGYGIETAGSAFIFLKKMAAKYDLDYLSGLLDELSEAGTDSTYDALLKKIQTEIIDYIESKGDNLTPNTKYDMLDYNKEAVKRFGNSDEEYDDEITDEDDDEDEVEEGIISRTAARIAGAKAGVKTALSNVSQVAKGIVKGGKVNLASPKEAAKMAKMRSAVGSFYNDMTKLFGNEWASTEVGKQLLNFAKSK